jgi:Flp pilus assembly protein TadG
MRHRLTLSFQPHICSLQRRIVSRCKRELTRSLTQSRARGQSLVEFAIMFPILVLLIFGAVDATQILMANYTVQQAARVAAHQAALIGGPDGSNGSLASATGTIAEQARIVLESAVVTRVDKATITVTCADPCRRYSAVTVSIEYVDDVWAPIGPFSNFKATASATRATEQDNTGAAGGCMAPFGCP